MKIVVAGASGFIGHALVAALRQNGHEVRRLVRRAAAAPDEVTWNPAARELNPNALNAVDAVVNLAGENLAGGRWTSERREQLMRSRVDATSTLVGAMAGAARCPAILLNASAIGFYGDRGDESVTETSGMGHGFLPEVCLAWETHAEGTVKLGVRTVLLRFGVVLGADGGALHKMLPWFRRGFGGRLGSGRQWTSWVTCDDVIGVVNAALTDARYVGPINVVAPGAVTNAEFTMALGRVLHRPTPVPAPAWALRLVFGQMADEALLASTRARPARLEELGYSFRHRAIDDALAAILRAEG